MEQSIDFKGQWLGHFAYGEEYGADLAGEKVTFRLFIDTFKDGQFTGRSVDIDGVGANFEIAQIKGFIDGTFISLTKEYPHLYSFDETGNTIEDKDKKHPIVSYSGEYNESTKSFVGQWELRMEIKPVGEYWLEDVCTGTWQIQKDD